MSKHWIDDGREQPTAAQALAERIEWERKHDPEARLPQQGDRHRVPAVQFVTEPDPSKHGASRSSRLRKQQGRS